MMPATPCRSAFTPLRATRLRCYAHVLFTLITLDVFLMPAYGPDASRHAL